MELELTRPEIENILSQWARTHGYKVQDTCVRSFRDFSYITCDLKATILVESLPPHPSATAKDKWAKSVEGTKYAPLQSTDKWRVEYSFQDEGPIPYDEEFDTEGEALAFMEAKEVENPLSGTIMHHLISPEGHIGY